MNRDPNELESPPTLRAYFVRAWRSSRRRPPVSFYLLLAILVVVLLGSQIVYVKDDPRRFAFFLTLNFVFFFVVLFRAVVDFFEIARDHFRAKEQLYRSTLGESEFASELGRRVAENEKDASE